MKLEQTIQRSIKSESGIIGQTCQLNYSTEWELVYHKVETIINLYHNLTSSRLRFHETDLHHEIGGTIFTLLNNSVKNVTERDTPFLMSKF